MRVLKSESPQSLESLEKEFGFHHEKFKKSFKLVEEKCIKLHRFHPSGREIWTVVGVEGDQLVDESQPYCSCRHFHYKVLRDKDDICYHLLGLRIARQMKVYDIIDLDDYEYSILLKFLINDIFESIRRKELRAGMRGHLEPR